jgi:hypothetical protein
MQCSVHSCGCIGDRCSAKTALAIYAVVQLAGGDASLEKLKHGDHRRAHAIPFAADELVFQHMPQAVDLVAFGGGGSIKCEPFWVAFLKAAEQVA